MIHSKYYLTGLVYCPKSSFNNYFICHILESANANDINVSLLKEMWKIQQEFHNFWVINLCRKQRRFQNPVKYTRCKNFCKKTRGGSRTAATSKMEHFVIIVNSILDAAAVLDPPLKPHLRCLTGLWIHRWKRADLRDVLAGYTHFQILRREHEPHNFQNLFLKTSYFMRIYIGLIVTKLIIHATKM